MDQQGKVANPARGHLNRDTFFPLSPFAPENLVSRDGFGRPILCHPPYSPYSVRLNLVLIHAIPPDFRDGVHPDAYTVTRVVSL